MILSRFKTVIKAYDYSALGFGRRSAECISYTRAQSIRCLQACWLAAGCCFSSEASGFLGRQLRCMREPVGE